MSSDRLVKAKRALFTDGDSVQLRSDQKNSTGVISDACSSENKRTEEIEQSSLSEKKTDTNSIFLESSLTCEEVLENTEQKRKDCTDEKREDHSDSKKEEKNCLLQESVCMQNYLLQHLYPFFCYRS